MLPSRFNLPPSVLFEYPNLSKQKPFKRLSMDIVVAGDDRAWMNPSLNLS
jgi:hypothetical protein